MYSTSFLKNIFNQLKRGDVLTLKNFLYYQRWKFFLRPEHNSIIDMQPWLTYPAIDFLQKNISSQYKIFEYGGGGSTLFFLQRASEVVTVEHDSKWFQCLQEIIKSKKMKGWNGKMIEAEPIIEPTTLSASNPGDYYSDDVNFNKSIFKNYVSFIDTFSDAYFDLILIDGRARTSCLKHSIPKLKTGGYLVLDNSERSYYIEQQKERMKKEFGLILNSFAPLPYSIGFSRTSIWRKR